jgi:hypothetical protein
MLVTHNAVFPLYPGQTYSTRFYAMCAQLHNKAPSIETTFRIGEMADSNLLNLANYLNDNYIQNMLGQHAVWAITDQANTASVVSQPIFIVMLFVPALYGTFIYYCNVCRLCSFVYNKNK